VNARAIIDERLPDLDDRWRPTVKRVVEVILNEIPDAEHALKWGQLTFTRAGDWHHWICGVSPAAKAVKLIIHKGAMLEDPHRALRGSGRYTRFISFRAPHEIDADVVAPILRQAAERQRDMLPNASTLNR
jgi:hypothetical protein